jgi:hypothetical protein
MTSTSSGLPYAGRERILSSKGTDAITDVALVEACHGNERASMPASGFGSPLSTARIKRCGRCAALRRMDGWSAGCVVTFKPFSGSGSSAKSFQDMM